MMDQRPDEGGNDRPQAEMPKYKCHKEVWALKIKEIRPDAVETGDGKNEQVACGAFIIPEEENFAGFRVDGKYMLRNNPQVGGYYVVYTDGYKSFSPAEAFEDGYTLIK